MGLIVPLYSYRMTQQIRYISLCIVLFCIATFQSCKLIDDDLSACGQEAQVTYQVKLITTLDVELNTVLSTDSDAIHHATFNKYFENIFVDYVHDVDLSFYKTTTQERAYHDNHIIDASEKSFTLFLKADSYKHLAACNIDDAKTVSLEEDSHPETMQLPQMKGDTLGPHTTGLFTARLDMDVLADSSQNFVVPLYMANSGVGVLIDTAGSWVKDIIIYVQDMATNFFVQDSLYIFDANPLIKAEQLPFVMPVQAKHRSEISIPARYADRLCYGTACYPSNDTTLLSDKNIPYKWRIRIYALTWEDKITETILYIDEQLLAGHLEIIQAKLRRNGQADAITAGVGASVQLEWKAGGEIDIEF